MAIGDIAFKTPLADAFLQVSANLITLSLFLPVLSVLSTFSHRPVVAMASP